MLGDKAPKIFNVQLVPAPTTKAISSGRALATICVILNWIIDRCEGKVDAKETAIGYVPNVDDIDIEGLDLTKDQLADILEVDKDLWMKEIRGY